jgi:hypothetical protein
MESVFQILYQQHTTASGTIMARAFEKKSDFNEIQKLIHGSPLFVDIETAMMIVANNFKSDADFAFHAFSWPDVKCVVMVCRNKYCL